MISDGMGRSSVPLGHLTSLVGNSSDGCGRKCGSHSFRISLANRDGCFCYRVYLTT